MGDDNDDDDDEDNDSYDIDNDDNIIKLLVLDIWSLHQNYSGS